MNKSPIIKTVATRAVSIALLSLILILILILIISLSCSEENGMSNAFLNQRKESASYVTDARDGKKYRTVKVGNLNWTAENAGYKSDSSWCYGSIAANCDAYGRLYAWQDAAMSACPAGWHLPSSGEWADLKDGVGNDSRSVMDKRWGGADRHGWSALGGGLRSGGSGSFGSKDAVGYWWGATENDYDTAAYNVGITNDSTDERFGGIYYYYDSKAYALSVRCVEDAPGAAKRYYAAFDANGGTVSRKLYALGAESGRAFGGRFPADPARPGHVFEGWFDGEGEGAVRYTESTAISRNVALTARWRSVPGYNVAFNTDGGTPAYIGSAAVDSGSALRDAFPANPAKSGNMFEGWFDGEAQYTAQTVIAKSVTLTARWRSVPVYTVAFNTGGGSPSFSSVAADSGKALGEKFPLTIPAKGDSVFGGWYDGEALYNAGTVITKSVTLTAKWGYVSNRPGVNDAAPAGAIKIASFADLCKIGKETAYPVSGTYEITGSIDASESRSMNGGLGFEPIGNFSGKMYGKGNTISGLYINRPDSNYVGLFGRITGSSVIISGVHLVNASITGKDYVGAIAGYSYAAISKSGVSGGTVTAVGGDAGGLVCWNWGTITDCYSTAAVSGKYAGGLVGWNLTNSVISRSYSVGTVTGSSDAGGLAAILFGTVENCYSASAVAKSGTAYGYGGGLIGSANTIEANPKITNCYSVGRTGSSGGLIGNASTFSDYKGSLTITSSYWDTEASGAATSAGKGAVGKTTAQMKDRSTYTGWNFTAVWSMNGGYPYLTALEAVSGQLRKAVSGGAFSAVAALPLSDSERERKAREDYERMRANAANR